MSEWQKGWSDADKIVGKHGFKFAWSEFSKGIDDHDTEYFKGFMAI